MYKLGWLFWVFQGFLLFEAIIYLISGHAEAEHYIVIFFGGSLLLYDIVRLILREMKIQKKMKEIREARESDKHDE